MTGASLGYDGYYNSTYLRDVGIFGRWWSASVYGLNYSAYSVIGSNDVINPQNNGNKHYGLTVCYATQSVSIRFNGKGFRCTIQICYN
ncbi:hypothetical protein J6Z37_02145 [Candidatus Saccharibacteria bacterium]|nr:hypothetical protein [Candidatus Saccharibacteria bacterium]